MKQEYIELYLWFYFSKFMKLNVKIILLECKTTISKNWNKTIFKIIIFVHSARRVLVYICIYI